MPLQPELIKISKRVFKKVLLVKFCRTSRTHLRQGYGGQAGRTEWFAQISRDSLPAGARANKGNPVKPGQLVCVKRPHPADKGVKPPDAGGRRVRCLYK